MSIPSDECFESYARSILKNQTQCEPLGSNITSRNCENPMELENAFTILKEALKDLDTVCKKPCNFLDIRTGARNFEPRVNDTRFYAYYINKVAVR